MAKIVGLEDLKSGGQFQQGGRDVTPYMLAQKLG